jgi:hypothetical protein
MEKLINFLKTNKFNLSMFVIFMIVSFYLTKCNSDEKNEQIKKLEQNMSYYKDSLIILKNKEGDINYYRSVMATDLKSLKEQNINLYNEVKKQEGKFIYISNIITKLKDSIQIISNNTKNNVNSGILKDGTRFITFKSDTIYDDDNSRKIDGDVFFKIKNDTIQDKSIKVNLSLEQSFGLSTGLVQDDSTKLLRIFVNTKYPNLKISKIDGALIDPQKSELIQSYFKPKRYTFGPQIGVGISTTLQPSIYIGVGMQYNLFLKDVKNIFK